MSDAQTFSRLTDRRARDGAERLLIYAFRRMGASGIADAGAAHAFVAAFGTGFRRPLLLMRTLMVELSSATAHPIEIAPWCCPRLTAAEAALADVATRASSDAPTAHLLLADLLGTRDAHGPLATVTALAQAFADQGLPLA